MGYARRGLRIAGGRVLLDGRDVIGARRRAASLRGAASLTSRRIPTSALNPALKVGTPAPRGLRCTSRERPAGSEERSHRRDAARGATRLRSRGARRPIRTSCRAASSSGSMLAMAFACRPKLIVLDEPTTGLDVTTQRHVLDTIRGLCRSYGVARRVREPRPRGRGRHRQHDRGDVRRPAGRARPGRESVPRPGPSVHPGSAARDSIADPGPRAGREWRGSRRGPVRARADAIFARALRVRGGRLPNRVPREERPRRRRGTGPGASALQRCLSFPRSASCRCASTPRSSRPTVPCSGSRG